MVPGGASIETLIVPHLNDTGAERGGCLLAKSGRFEPRMRFASKSDKQNAARKEAAKEATPVVRRSATG